MSVGQDGEQLSKTLTRQCVVYTIVSHRKGFSVFEWDEEKRIVNLEKHGIDFMRAKEIWLSPVLEMRSKQEHGEDRFIAIGTSNNVLIAVIYTWRDDNRRLISARKARKNEQKNYENNFRRRT
jgi:uncharacterized DUF497 family protein